MLGCEMIQVTPLTEPQIAFAVALVDAQGKMRALVKDKQGFNSKFVSTETVVKETKEVLHDCGLAVVPLGSECVKGENIDIETKNGVSNVTAFNLHTTYRVYHRSGHWVDMVSDMAVIPEKGKPLDKAIAAASTFCLGYFLRGLLQIPRVGSEQEVDERDDRGFDPDRLTQRQIVDELAEHQKTLGKERYELIVGTEPPQDHESALTVLELLRAEKDRDGLIRTMKMVLKELGGTDEASVQAVLVKHGLPNAKTLKEGPIAELKLAAATLRKAWKGE